MEKTKKENINNLESSIAIKLDSVSFAYPDNKVCLENISFEINKGEKVLLLGSNGSGKSTLSKLIDGILKPTSGDIYIFNTLMTDNNAPELRENIGLIFQNPDEQFICSTVKEEIAFGLENKSLEPNKMKDIIFSCAKQVEMDNYLDFDPSSLSGGQKQRIALASFIALNPKILILDEATSMLDPKGKREVDNIISKMKKENPDLTLIKISHELEDYFFFDRIIILKDSSIVFNNTPSVLSKNKDILIHSKINKPFVLSLIDELNKEKINIKSQLIIEDKLVEELCHLK